MQPNRVYQISDKVRVVVDDQLTVSVEYFGRLQKYEDAEGWRPTTSEDLHLALWALARAYVALRLERP